LLSIGCSNLERIVTFAFRLEPDGTILVLIPIVPAIGTIAPPKVGRIAGAQRRASAGTARPLARAARLDALLVPALERRLPVDEHRGDLTILHRVLPTAGPEVSVEDAGIHHAVSFDPHGEQVRVRAEERRIDREHRLIVGERRGGMIGFRARVDRASRSDLADHAYAAREGESGSRRAFAREVELDERALVEAIGARLRRVLARATRPVVLRKILAKL